MHPADTFRVAVLVATAHRSDLLASRALPSIERQTRAPWRVVVVDDARNDAAARQTRHSVRAWQPAGIVVDFLRNRRTKGASGAWNSGLDHLLRTCGDPRRVFVATLDDDDRWEVDHLERCLTVAERRRLDMVAAPFQRIEENAEPALVIPPPSLQASSFLVRNPGIQGSNLVCRLSVLLEAGLFDESLPSCTDRDLCIRIAELPGVRYGTTADPTVHHFACRSRPRLSTYRSPSRLTGLDGFFRKYRGRMTEAERAQCRARARRLFGWEESLTERLVALPAQRASTAPARRHGDPSQDRPHLIAGMIADADRLEEVRGLLADLQDLAGDPGLSGLDVLMLENGLGRTADDDLRAIVAHERARGLRIHLVDRRQHLEHAARGIVLDGGANQGRKLPIAYARTALQTYLYAFAKRRPGAVVWIVDDDMRLDPLVAGRDGRLRRSPLDLVSMLRGLRALHGGGAVDIAIGAYTGAPPLPFAATVRVQLVDLVASLQWLAAQDPSAVLPDRSADNAALRSGRRDYYYDLSRSETDRLEAPFWVCPAFPGERVDEAFVRVACAAERILAGEQVFRPLAIGPEPLESTGDGLQRGGNTFVLDIETLRLAPNPSPAIDGRPSRRSDMLWTLLQRRCFGKRVKAVPIALYHDRSRVGAGTLDVERTVDDVRGYAMLSALQDAPRTFAVKDDEGIALAEDATQGIAERVHKFLEERLAAFRLSFHRIRGLTRVLRGLMDDTERWWTDDTWRTPVGQLRTFADRLAACYELETLRRIEREARTLDARHVREFLEHLPEEIADHRRRLADTSPLARGLEAERVANAKAVADRLASPAGALTVLGCGAEGVALTDGTHVFKVFDYWKPLHSESAAAFLRSLVGAWTDARSLYPLLDFRESGHHAVLVYAFEASEPYTGGHGPGMVTLLAECRRYGIVCRNLHPDNLRVVDGRVRLIDYGSDLRRLESEHDYTMMCRRAWLSYRWAGRADLKAIMRRALNGADMPELDGFDRFHEAVRHTTGHHERPEDVVLDMAGSEERVLDYGCGNGWLAKKLAGKGMEVLGYDPDPGHQLRWKSLCRRTGKLRFTHEQNELVAAGLFDLVVCRRVLCTIESDARMRAVLGDLRALVSGAGRVIVTVCDPHFTFGGPTPEAERELPRDTRYEDTFVWRKTVRVTGRVRRDVHRPERALRREFARAGLAVCRRVEVPSVDLERFEPTSDHLAFELRPLAPLPGEVTLLIKACAMEAATLDVQVPHLVSQLEGPRAFAERILVIDSREDGFLRQHTCGSLRVLRDVANHLADTGWIDRIVEGPGDGDAAAALYRRWFGTPAPRAHAATGAQLASTLAGFEACRTRYVLHADADVMVGRLDCAHDYLADMLAAMVDEPWTLTVAFNIAMDHDRPYTSCGVSGAWRTEARAGMIDRVRLREASPLPNRLDGDHLALPWYRALDRAVAQGAGRSLRGGDRQTFYVHPPNPRKGDLEQWLAVVDRIEHSVVPRIQMGQVDWTGGLAEWMGPERREPFVFVVSGRDVPPGRLRRCIQSMARQKGPHWGAVLFDDASDPRIGEHFEIVCASLGERCTVVRNRRRRGLLANMVTAIRMICTDPETVIVTLDADDALLGDRVLERLAAEYEQGADVTVGSMLRTDKATEYPVCFDRPRERRGGNVWQHLRSFRKRLFDAVPDEALRLNGEYVDVATDWAFMLPIVEMAARPVYIAAPLYLYEPSGIGKGAGREGREATIGRIVAKAPVTLHRAAAAVRSTRAMNST